MLQSVRTLSFREVFSVIGILIHSRPMGKQSLVKIEIAIAIVIGEWNISIPIAIGILVAANGRAAETPFYTSMAGAASG